MKFLQQTYLPSILTRLTRQGEKSIQKENLVGKTATFDTFIYFALRKKCPYSKLFQSVFPRIRTEYGEIRSISPYSVRMRENMDQNNSEFGHFLHSVDKYPINILSDSRVAVNVSNFETFQFLRDSSQESDRQLTRITILK